MLAAFDALLAQPLLLLLTLSAGAAIGISVERLVEGQRRADRRRKWRRRKSGGSRQGSPRVSPIGAADIAVDQLKLVRHGNFKPRPLLNRSEARVFRELDRMVIARNPEWQVMAQVCVGEFIGSDDAAAYRCINSKRVDLLLMDQNCAARHAIEYQGKGHHQGTAAARDAIKKEALRKAGIGYHEVVAGRTTPGELKRLVERLVPDRKGGGVAIPATPKPEHCLGGLPVPPVDPGTRPG